MQKKIDIIIHEDIDLLALYIENELVYVSEENEAQILDVLDALSLEYKKHVIYFEEVHIKRLYEKGGKHVS